MNYRENNSRYLKFLKKNEKKNQNSNQTKFNKK